MLPFVVAQAWPYVVGVLVVFLLILGAVVISFFNLWVQAFAAGARVTFIELIEDGIGRLGELVLGRYLRILNASVGAYRTQSDTITKVQRSALAVIVCVGDRDYRAVNALIRIIKSPFKRYINL